MFFRVYSRLLNRFPADLANRDFYGTVHLEIDVRIAPVAQMREVIILALDSFLALGNEREWSMPRAVGTRLPDCEGVLVRGFDARHFAVDDQVFTLCGDGTTGERCDYKIGKNRFIHISLSCPNLSIQPARDLFLLIFQWESVGSSFAYLTTRLPIIFLLPLMNKSPNPG